MEISPTKESSTENKARASLAKGQFLHNRAVRTGCKRVLDTVDWVAEGVKNYMQSVGAMDEEGRPVIPETSKGGKKGKRASEQGAASSSGGDLPLLKTGSVHHTYNKPSAMPVSELRRWLNTMEPSIFTDSNLHAMLQRGRKASNVEKLCQHLEHMTGIAPDEPLNLHKEDNEKYVQFLNQLKALNEANGRPARDLVLPVDWTTSKVAPWKIVETDNLLQKFNIVHTKTGMMKRIPMKILEKVTDIAHLVLDMPWSEARCLVRGPTTACSGQLIVLYDTILYFMMLY